MYTLVLARERDAGLGLTVMSTSRSSEFSSVISLSMVNPESLPLISAETLGWSMPMRSPAAFWVRLRAEISLLISAAKAAFANCSSGLERPRSAKTFPLLSVMFSVIALFSLHRCLRSAFVHL